MASATRDVDEVMKMFPTTYSVLVSVAAFEAAWGFYMLCCTKGALAAAIGRHLEVGSKASPALEPALSYAGGLRLAVALTILVAVTTPYVDDEDFAHLTHRLAVAARALGEYKHAPEARVERTGSDLGDRSGGPRSRGGSFGLLPLLLLRCHCY
jgi:hypothetical protein